MNTKTVTRPFPATPLSSAHDVWFGGVVRSEWVKLRSLRSNIWIVISAAVVMIVTGVIFSGFVGGVFTNTAEGAEFLNNPTGATLRGMLLAPLVIGTLGVMAMTAEYATGTIRTSLTMVPKRFPILWAKAAVVGVVAFCSMLLSVLIVFAAGQAIIASGNVDSASLGDPGVLRALLGAAFYLTGVALFGLGLGATLRSSAAAISTLVATLLILPGLAGILLPATWRDNVLKFLPSNAGEAFTQVKQAPEFLTPAQGLAVFIGWIALALGSAAISLRHRPA
jgi:ABC-2 type transport system permease protein